MDFWQGCPAMPQARKMNAKCLSDDYNQLLRGLAKVWRRT